MKTTTFKLWCVFAVLFLGLASCTPKADDPDPATLTVAPGELTFQNGEGSETVKITTNQESWVASSPQEGVWIELVPAGTSLTIKVKKNEISEPRSTYVIVNAGAATPQKIKVTQNPADIVLSLSPEAIDVPAEGGMYTVDISSNNDTWNIELESAEDWISMSVHKAAKIAYITVKENATSQERQAVLRATNKSKAMEVNINQAGKQSTRYVMPLIKRKPKGYDIVSYEVARKSILKRFSGALPGWGFFNEEYFFINNSELFYETMYSLNTKTNSLVEIRVKSSDYNTVVAEKSELLDFYKAGGFEITSQTSNLITGRHKTEPFNLKITLSPESGVVIDFEQYAEQTKDYKTFDKLPEVPIVYFGNKEWPFEKIKEVELKEGATEGEHSLVSQGKHKGQISLGVFHQPESKRPYLVAGYFFDWEAGTPEEKLGTLEEIIKIYSDHTLGFWEDTEVTGKLVMTKEFRALLEREGWKYRGFQNTYYLFFHSGKKLLLATRAVAFSDINPGKTSLQMNFLPGEEQDTDMQHFNAKIKRWNEKFK